METANKIELFYWLLLIVLESTRDPYVQHLFYLPSCYIFSEHLFHCIISKTVAHNKIFHSNKMPSNSSDNNKSSLTFESVVCSQLELQRRAANFSRRRSTMCRPLLQFPASPLNRSGLLTATPTQLSTPSSSTRVSTSLGSDMTSQFSKTRNSSSSKRSRSSFTPSACGIRTESVTERPSLGSMFYWDRLSRNAINKKNGSRWSLDFPKETPFYWSLRSRLIEEYNESESLLEFAKKTILVLMKTKEATIFLCLILIFPVIMMGIGVSHLGDCPRQTNLPIYLFVAGSVLTTKLLQNLWHKYRLQQKRLTDEEPSSNHNDGHTFIDGLMTSFLVLWFFIGQYWFVTIGYPPHFEQPLENPDMWCHKTVVYCALASLVLTYFFFFSFIAIVVFLVLFTRYTIIKQASVQ